MSWIRKLHVFIPHRDRILWKLRVSIYSSLGLNALETSRIYSTQGQNPLEIFAFLASTDLYFAAVVTVFTLSLTGVIAKVPGRRDVTLQLYGIK